MSHMPSQGGIWVTDLVLLFVGPLRFSISFHDFCLHGCFLPRSPSIDLGQPICQCTTVQSALYFVELVITSPF